MTSSTELVSYSDSVHFCTGNLELGKSYEDIHSIYIRSLKYLRLFIAPPMIEGLFSKSESKADYGGEALSHQEAIVKI